jgi:hypothetical protein
MRQTKKRRGGGAPSSSTKKIERGKLLRPLTVKVTQNSNTVPGFTSQALDLTYPKFVSIRRIPTPVSTATLAEPMRPKSVVLENRGPPHKYGLTREPGSRNIFKSLKSKQNFKKMLKNIYGSTSENVYTFWKDHKQNLLQTLKNRERLLGKSNVNSNSNPELYKAITNIYGKNYAEFQNYRQRSHNVGIEFPFQVKSNISSL